MVYPPPRRVAPSKENTALTSLMQALLGQNGIFLACPSDKVGGGNDFCKRGRGRRHDDPFKRLAHTRRGDSRIARPNAYRKRNSKQKTNGFCKQKAFPRWGRQTTYHLTACATNQMLFNKRTVGDACPYNGTTRLTAHTRRGELCSPAGDRRSPLRIHIGLVFSADLCYMELTKSLPPRGRWIAKCKRSKTEGAFVDFNRALALCLRTLLHRFTEPPPGGSLIHKAFCNDF